MSDFSFSGCGWCKCDLSSDNSWWSVPVDLDLHHFLLLYNFKLESFLLIWSVKTWYNGDPLWGYRYTGQYYTQGMIWPLPDHFVITLYVHVISIFGVPFPLMWHRDLLYESQLNPWRSCEALCINKQDNSRVTVDHSIRNCIVMILDLPPPNQWLFDLLNVRFSFTYVWTRWHFSIEWHHW